MLETDYQMNNKPIIIQFMNTSTEQELAVFPNLATIQSKENYGNPDKVLASSSIEGITLGEIIFQCSVKPLQITDVKMISSTKKQHDNLVKLFDDDGLCFLKNEPANKDFETMIRGLKKLDAKMHFEFLIEASTTVIFEIYTN